MKASLVSEFRKIVSIRSTYAIVLVCFLLTVIFAFWAEGYRATPDSLAEPTKLSNQITGAVGAVSLILALIGVLVITHEYRFNTIIYTLTASNSRLKTIVAKVLTVTIVSVILTLLFAIISPLLTRLGLAIKGYELAPQVFNLGYLWWRCFLYGWCYMMTGLLLGVLFRSQIGAIVTLMLAQASVEPLLGFLLKSNSIYLPFNALNSVLSESAQISSARALLVFMIYLTIGWGVASVLFVRRDAN